MILCTTTLILLSSSQAAFASSTKDTRLLQDPVCRNEALILRNETEIGSGVYWSGQSWMFQLGDLDGDGFFDLPAGLDALTCVPRGGGTKLTAYDLAFSTDGGFSTFLDGDLLRMRPNGVLDTWVGEQELLDAIQHQSGSFDLDGVAWKDDQLWFTVKDPIQSSTLGTVDDGDILLYDPYLGQITRMYTEADVQGIVDQATGSSTSIGDVRALSFYPSTDELVFTIQSPSAQDATVFGVGSGGGGGWIIPGWAEADWAFQEATELDALAFLPEVVVQPPVLSTDLPYLDQNSSAKIRIRHGSPLGLAKGLFSRKRGFEESLWGGAGAIFLDQNDSAYKRQIANGWLHGTQLDASGSGDFDWVTQTLPPQYSYVDLYIQAFDVATRTLSNPIVLRLQ